MSAKYLVALDRLHLRIYRYSQQPGQFTPSIQPVDAFDLPRDPSRYSASSFDRSDRFSRLERPPSEYLNDDSSADQEEDGEVVKHLVERISVFLEKNADSTWNLAAGSTLCDQVIDLLPEKLRLRLDRVISKDLVGAPPVELREYFVMR